MNDLRTAAQQALEALEWHYRQGHSNTLGGLRLKIDEKTLRNLKAALAEPVQEPQPLTEEEIEKAYREIWRDLPSDFDHTSSGWIELGIKYSERVHGIT